MSDKWGPGGPPEEAYSRVTDAERFRGLHAAARSLATALQDAYDVTRLEGVAPDPTTGDAAPTLTLVPSTPEASSLAMVFTAFPGLLLRYGLESDEPLPACGCDACDETLPELTEKMILVVRAVVAGTVGERLRREGLVWWHERWLETADGGGSGSSRVERGAVKALRARMPGDEKRWAPWPLRG